MWKLRVFSLNREENSIAISEDDVVFIAVIKRGPFVHTKRKSYVRCFHIAELEKGKSIGFQMSILNATSIESKHKDFINDGLMGKWKLVPPKVGEQQFPQIVLLEVYQDANVFMQEVLEETNPDWVRKSYKF